MDRVNPETVQQQSQGMSPTPMTYQPQPAPASRPPPVYYPTVSPPPQQNVEQPVYYTTQSNSPIDSLKRKASHDFEAERYACNNCPTYYKEGQELRTKIAHQEQKRDYLKSYNNWLLYQLVTLQKIKDGLNSDPIPQNLIDKMREFLSVDILSSSPFQRPPEAPVSPAPAGPSPVPQYSMQQMAAPAPHPMQQLPQYIGPARLGTQQDQDLMPPPPSN